MQSGRGKSGLWVLEFDQTVVRRPEALNGWTSADGTTGQVRLTFDSLEQAQDFADKNGLAYFVKASSARKVRPRNYMDNYKYIPLEDGKK